MVSYGKNTGNGYADECAAMDERALRDHITKMEREDASRHDASTSERLTVARRELHSRFQRRVDDIVNRPKDSDEPFHVVDVPSSLQTPQEAATYRDAHLQEAGKRWEFDSEVTQNFPAMLGQSIPGLRDMRTFTDELCTRVLADHCDAHVIDIGASRGDAVASLMDQGTASRYTLFEVAQPMVDVLEQRFGDRSGTEIVNVDLSECPEAITRRAPVDLALSVLTLMFVPPENRQAVVQAVYDALVPGGAFVVVEKTLGNDARTQRLLVDTYHDFKRHGGYTDQQVERKRMSLKGALIPFTSRGTEELLHNAGFVSTQQYWRALQFVGWIAFKKEN